MKNLIIFTSIKITTVLFILISLGCNTVVFKSPTHVTKEYKSQSEVKELNIIRQKLSESVLNSVDSYYSDFAFLILQLIEEKKWEELSKLTEEDFYNSYVVESSGTIIDYCMFMLHTGDEGISTNYSLNEVEDAYFTSSYETFNGVNFEGIYLYPSGETEYFKIFIQDEGNGLIITRE